MKIAYFANQTALQSEPIWQAFLESCKKVNIRPVENTLDADFALIWSVLWKGRLEKNKNIYYHYRNLGKPVFIIEVGSLYRGKTWKVCINNITNEGVYANDSNFLIDRHKKLNVTLKPFKNLIDKPILIAGQHDSGLQWNSSVSNLEWINETIDKLRQYTDKPIYVRPHPRNKFDKIHNKNVFMEEPVKILGSYDEYDLKYNYSSIINYNSGIGIKASINGVPLICHNTSLAYETSMPFDKILEPFVPNREDWLQKIVHTEWTIEEIADGIPLKRLLSKIS
jgi:hypothetical protein